MLIVPLGMFLTFFLMIKPRIQEQTEDLVPLVLQDDDVVPTTRMSLTEKLGSIRGLLRYMIPLGLVYFFEYLINQGIQLRNRFSKGFDMVHASLVESYQIFTFFIRT